MKKVKGGKNAVSASVQADVNRALSRAAMTLNGSSFVKRLTQVAAATTTAGGVLTGTLSSAGVQTLPATEWNSFATRFVDYRVVKASVHYVPHIVVNTQNAAAATTTGGSMVVARDPSGASAAATLAAAFSLEGSKAVSANKPWSITIMASEDEHMLFTVTTAAIAAANRYQVLWHSTGTMTASTQYGEYYYEWIVEYRGAQ